MGERRFKTTVDACLDGLGDYAITIARNPRETVVPAAIPGVDTWNRAEALMAQRLTGGEPFAIGRTLGEGGEGIVHEAEQRSLGRRVAVKTLLPDRRTPAAATSLLREAWLLGRLEHPNIVPIHDLRRDESGAPQAILKRIEGTVWSGIVHDEEATRSRFGSELFEHNLEVLSQVCQAVRFAHSRGVVHRDLKPDNVMIGPFGEVYLLDWGIAVVVDDIVGLPRTHLDGSMAGTPSYMAPEMLGLEELAVSEATDVYLLGAMLFEICVGRPPHDAVETRHVIASILSSPPPVPDSVSPDLGSLIRDAMAPDPEARPSVDTFRLRLLDHRRHVASNALAAKAMSRLAALEASVALPDASLQQAYDGYGACRFGFQQALETWPDNPTAKRGLHRASCAIVRRELRRGDVDAAAAQLASMSDPPPELEAEIDAARMARAEDRKRIASLERVDRQYDARTGRDVRLFLVLLLASIWAIAPVFTLLGEWHGIRQPVPGVIGPVVYLSLLGALYLRHEKTIRSTVVNRRTIAVLAMAMVAMLLLPLGGMGMGLERNVLRSLQMQVGATAAAGGALTIDPRLWWAAGAYAVGYLVTSWFFADDTTGVMVAHALTHGVTAVTVYRMWQRPPAETHVG
ncbi:MAG: serine/threonine-protein kinase [Myxococcota bacterium]